MALHIQDPEAEKLAEDLAALTGEIKTDAVIPALRERLHAVKGQHAGRLAERLDEIANDCSSLPLLDDRSPDQMLYDDQGLPR
jgi:antitoxin VapB